VSLHRAITFVAGCSFAIFLIDHCTAWEATYPKGPVRIENLFPMRALPDGPEPPPAPPTPISVFLSYSGGKKDDIFGHQQIAYPQNEGVPLGTGWNFLLNRKTYSSCIDFTEGKDVDQSATLASKRVVDQETLDIALNVSMSASVSGSIYAFKGSAKGSFGLNGSYHYGSKDDVYVAQASVTNGAHYVTPPKNGATIKLKPEMAKLRARPDSEAFRAACGDGFVASIVSGADLYLMFHFHDLTETDKITIQSSFTGSGGMGDLFKASAEAASSSTIQKFYDKNQLDLQFAQDGGRIKLLPVDLATAQKKVQDLSVEAFAGPRPIFIVVVPYTELPDLEAKPLFSVLDLKQRANRYLQRLRSVYAEIMVIEDDYFRNRFLLVGDPAVVSADQYLYWYVHQIRSENISAIHDEVLNEIKLMTTVARDLDDSKCGSSDGSASRCEEITPSKSVDGIECSGLHPVWMTPA
jgi:hypothetical protein